MTTGKAYCGLVGSLRRHEYAVMGPSTNLSARLMAKASMGQIICDSNIKNYDRLHHFRSLGEVNAKGYSYPVPIYKPQFIRGSLASIGSFKGHLPPSLNRQVRNVHSNIPNTELIVNVLIVIGQFWQILGCYNAVFRPVR